VEVKRNLVVAAAALFSLSVLLSFAQDTLPRADPPFTGKIDIDIRKSVPAWPEEQGAPKGAPNIVLILIDDVGFSTTSTFGGPVDTPNFTRLAGEGLRYNRFHVNALCSPTRAALLSGRNAHEIGFGTVAESGSGYPGYDTLWPKSSASIAEVLKDNGYSTAAFGKWHNTPTWQISPAGPFDRWPTSLGFEYFYGFLRGADNQYYPRIYRDTIPVEPSSTPDQGYHFTVDMTNDAIRWLHLHDAAARDKPFFLYFATGAVHYPHQVPKEWIDRFKGKFDAGWDKLREEDFEREKKLGVIPADTKLTPRPEGLPAWDSLSPDEKKLMAHEAEVYAAYVAQTDEEVGRLLQAIKDEDESDNTIVLWIFGDNGGSAQGGLLGTDAHDVNGVPKNVQDRLATEDELGSEVFMNHFAAAWAWAESTPFQGAKTDASYLGGTRDPLIISWPARIKQVGGLRTQFAHVNDVAPTLYEAVGITPPKVVNGIPQTPLEGTSLVYTFDHPDEPSRHRVQYFEGSGNRAIYKDGWWAGEHLRFSWDHGKADTKNETLPDYEIHPWELYNLDNDYSQAENLAAKYPEKLKELQALFDEEAKRNQVYPLLPHGSLPTPQLKGKTTFTYREGVDRLISWMAPTLTGHAYTITANVDIPARGASGVIVAQGGRYGGFTLFVKDNHVFYEINVFGYRSGRIVASDPLTAGRAHIVVDLVPESGRKASDAVSFAIYQEHPHPGTGTLRINDKLEGAGQFINVNEAGDGTLINVNQIAGETLDVGSDLGSAVSSEYESPNRFTGKIETVTIQLK
jgi:arylsulfatase A-like enzyme